MLLLTLKEWGSGRDGVVFFASVTSVRIALRWNRSQTIASGTRPSEGWEPACPLLVVVGKCWRGFVTGRGGLVGVVIVDGGVVIAVVGRGSHVDGLIDRLRGRGRGRTGQLVFLGVGRVSVDNVRANLE